MRDRKKREIKLHKKYEYADLIVFALIAGQGIETDELKTHSEVIISKDLEK